MSSSSSKSSFDSGRRPLIAPGMGGSGGTVMPPPWGGGVGRVPAAGTGRAGANRSPEPCGAGGFIGADGFIGAIAGRRCGDSPLGIELLL